LRGRAIAPAVRRSGPAETKVTDDRNNNNQYDSGTDKQRRTTIEYIYPTGNLRLPGFVREYNTDGTVYRSTATDYAITNYVVMGTNLTRRIIGLPSYTELYEGNFTKLIARTEYSYDSPNVTGTEYLKAHAATVRQHDSANYGTGFAYRGNPTEARRYSVVNGVPGASITTKTGYFTTGTVAWARDGRGDETQFYYDDTFTAGLTTSPNPATYAYPTRVTQLDGASSFSSQLKYHYDHGGVTEAIDPKSFNAPASNFAKTVNTYDTKGRLEKAAIWRSTPQQPTLTEYSYLRNVYSTDHNWVQSFTTVNSLAEETTTLHLLDGIGRKRITISDHPGSDGTLRSQYVVFDVMGRIVERSNPTEINIYWSPAGQDSAYVCSKQEYDWKGRPTIYYHQDHTSQNPRKREYSYTGCGCAGSDVTTLTDEVGRVQKFYSDLFGRQIKSELWNGSSVYTTTETKYNVRDQVEEYKQSVGGAGASLTATSSYDGHGRLWVRKLPIEGIGSPGTIFTYHDDDEVQTVTDPRGVVTTYAYNQRGLVTNVTYNTNGAPNVAAFGPVSYTYDEAGNRLSMTDAAGNTAYAYDNLSRMESEGRVFDDISSNRYYLYYQYNPAGQVKEVKDHFNDVIYYNYDKAGRVISVTGADLTRNEQYQFTSTATNSLIKYRAWDEVRYMKYGNNLVSMATYDKRLRPTFLK
jgi:YD repeat-containing protein